MKGGKCMMKILNNKIAVVGILAFLSLVVIALSGYMVYMLNTKEECFCEPVTDLISLEEPSEEVVETPPIYVEVKGAVNHPGVFEVNENNIINDVIALAGGLKDNAYTDNINLSKKVSDELVVYVFTKEEYKKNSSSNNTHTNTSSTSSSKESYQIDEATKNNISIITSSNSETTTSQDTTSKLININTASAQELTSLPGIGETKANNIVSHRTENGYFKTIEDLKNVSGIGDATFEQLKDYITV